MTNRFRIGLLACCASPFAWGQSYLISTIAGADRLRDGGPATSAPLRNPAVVVADHAGNVYVADTDDYRVRKISPSGIITTFAGAGLPGFYGDSGPASRAAIGYIAGMAVDGAGNLYLADLDSHRVRKVSTSGIISTVAGSNRPEFSGDGGAATSAQLDPFAVAMDSAGNLYIADQSNYRVRKVAAGTGVITTIAGNGSRGYSGDGGPATSAQIGTVTSVAVDLAGNVYFTDYDNNIIRKVANGVISTFAGNGRYKYAGDGMFGAGAAFDPWAIFVDAAGNLYIADMYNDRIRKIGADTNTISTVAGNGTYAYGGDGGPATAAALANPASIYVDSAGTLYIADAQNDRVRKVAGGAISTIAGCGVNDGGSATSAFFNFPRAVALDAAGNLYIADGDHSRVRKVIPAGAISTVAGTGLWGSTMDPKAANSELSIPMSVATDAAGNLYIADSANALVLKVTPAGDISVAAGTGKAGTSGDGGPATSAQIGVPTAVAVDAAGNLYIADRLYSRVRKVTSTGIISTVAGNGAPKFAGDGGPAVQAQLDPFDLAVDGAGNLFVADRNNYRVRKIDPAGIITTVAGAGVEGYSGDGGRATAALISGPTGLAVDAKGNLFIADFDNFVVRRVDATGTIATVAGSGEPGYGGDGGPALSALIDPYRLALDSAGNLYLAEYYNDRVRKLAVVQAAKLAASAGDQQSGPVGQQLPLALTVAVTDASGVPAGGVTVQFAVSSGTATLSAASAVTGANGTASTRVTFGSTAGDVAVTATVSGLPVATFHLTALPASSTVAPHITAGGVVSAGLSTPAVRALAPNAIATVFGEGFAAAGTLRPVGPGDLVNGKVPTTLGGVCVVVGGVLGPVFLLAANQINFQVPPVVNSGTVPVQVAANCGLPAEVRSNIEQVPMQSAAPEFFYLKQSTDGRNPIAAANAVTGALIGAAGLIPGAATTPARPGDVLALYFTGGGTTDPPVQAGELADKSATVTGAVTVTFGGMPLAAGDVLYTGVTPANAGLYQLNIRVPDAVPDGDQPLVLSIGGYSSPGKAYVTVLRAGAQPTAARFHQTDTRRSGVRMRK
ncbi:MAG TPA: Ig-like domain-containing protein [Bryobacteraceae bacterium]|nr:Ig-like domain-containing protein [Bryobacteraceae bacterium]